MTLQQKINRLSEVRDELDSKLREYAQEPSEELRQQIEELFREGRLITLRPTYETPVQS